MAIDLLTLFARLGRVGKVLRACAQFRAGGLTADAEALVAEYDALRSAAAPVTGRLPTSRSAAGDIVGTLVQVAADTVVAAVRADQSARSWTVDEAIAEVVRQMGVLGETVPECLTDLTATPLPLMSGDGLLVTTLKGGGSDTIAGVLLENVFAETLWLTCTDDAQTGDVEAGREVFRSRGGVAESDVWSELWPAGSGADATITVADPASDAAGGGNQLTNSGYDTFTAANAPDGWVIQVGSAGTHVLAGGSAQAYAGANCLALPGSATLATLYQTFEDEDGTEGEVLPLTRYAVAVRLKASAAPATGTLVLELVDGSSAVVNDPQGNPLRATIDCTALTTTYAAQTAVWVTPRSLPAECRFRVRVGTAIETGRTVYADALCFAPMDEAYAGGPAVKLVAGATPFVRGDGWTIEVENDRAMSDYGSTWQALLDRLFGLRALSLQAPSDSSAPTYIDAMITD